MNELALFAGAGGGILGGTLLGWRTVCAVEIDRYAASILLRRQNDGILASFPIWDDVRTFDGRPWRGLVDVVSGGFPCTDISAAGKGAGITGKESGLWRQMWRIVREVRPQYVFVENSPMLAVRGINRVLGDLAEVGYDAEWGVLGASDLGAPHYRKRIWILAYSDSVRELQSERGVKNFRDRACNSCKDVSYADRERLEGFRANTREAKISEPWDCSWWSTEPDVDRMAYGVAARVDRIKAIGNGQVPAVAAEAWKILYDRAFSKG